jgi:hypothetical protein
LHDGRYDGYSRHFEILRTAMKEKSHEKRGIQNTKFAKGTTKVTKATDAAVSAVDGVLHQQYRKLSIHEISPSFHDGRDDGYVVVGVLRQQHKTPWFFAHESFLDFLFARLLRSQ